MELTAIQKDILIALINLQRENERAVKGEEIAKIINRNPGTVRNQMQSLKVLELVDGVPGPKGGYKATGNAYEALNITLMDEEAQVPIYKNGEVVDGATVAELSFLTVRHPDLCHAMIKVLGNIRNFEQGDKVQMGPTPVNKLVVRGDIVGRDDTENTLVFSINEMISMPKKPVKYYSSKNIISIEANSKVKEALKILLQEKIQGAPVIDNEKIIGVISYNDIANAIVSDKIDEKISNIMNTEIITIDGESSLTDAVKLLNEHKMNFVIITIEGNPQGILSKTDILHELAIY